MEIQRQRFAEVVRNLRSGRPIREFAKVVGVSHPSVLDWENGIGIPRRENLEKIAELRGESLDELLAYLSGKEAKDSMDRVLSAIKGASKEQLAEILIAIAHRMKET